MDNKPHTPPVLAAEFSNERDAAIACGMLQTNGIEAFVVDDAMATIYGAGATWAPVRLYVRADDAEKAAELLAAAGDN